MICPYCGEKMDAEYVDVGVGFVQCGPFYCACGASEIGPELDDWIYKDRDNKAIYLHAKKRYNPYYEKKMHLRYAYVLKPGAPFTKEELSTGVYRGRISPYANTFKGQLVNIEVAKYLYELGILDNKNIEEC